MQGSLLEGFHQKLTKFWELHLDIISKIIHYRGNSGARSSVD